MTDKSKMWALILQALVVFSAIVTIIWNSTQYLGSIKDHERRITAIEQSETSRQETVARIDARTARMEGQLSIVVERRP